MSYFRFFDKEPTEKQLQFVGNILAILDTDIKQQDIDDLDIESQNSVSAFITKYKDSYIDKVNEMQQDKVFAGEVSILSLDLSREYHVRKLLNNIFQEVADKHDVYPDYEDYDDDDFGSF